MLSIDIPQIKNQDKLISEWEKLALELDSLNDDWNISFQRENLNNRSHSDLDMKKQSLINNWETHNENGCYVYFYWDIQLPL